MARQVNVHIELEGGKEITRHLGLVISQELFDHHQFTINVPFDQLEESGEHFFNKSHQDVMGKKVTISFSPRSGQDDFDFTFQGIVTEIRLQSLTDMSSAFVLKGYGATIVLEDSIQRRSFLRGSVSDLFSKVLQPYPQNLLRKQLKPQNGSRRVPFTQYNESNYRFLCRVADRCGEWFYYNGQELLLGQPSGQPDTDFLVDGRQNFDVAMVLHPAAFSMSGYDYTENASFVGQSSSQNVDGLTTLSEFALNESDRLFSQSSLLSFDEIVGTQSEADELTKMERSARVASMVDFKGKGDTPTISVGTVLNVKGSRINLEGKRYEESFGKYRVISIRHEVNTAGSYTNSFSAVPESAQHPPRNPNVVNPLGETELAEVIANDDPDKLGRVRVKYQWSQGNQQDQESIWIRVGTFYTGQGKGGNFVPEIGAQVVVGYELNLAENPFVVTSLYPKPGEEINYTSENNEKKVIGTRSGNTLLFYDKDGDQKIQIMNANKTDTHVVLSFKDDGKITIHAENGLVEIKSKDLAIEASNGISIKAEQSFELEANEIKLKANQNIALEASQNIQMKATSETKIEGTAGVKIKGAQLEAKADGMAEVSSSGVLTLKGTLVQIN